MAQELTINPANQQIEILLTPIIIEDLATSKAALVRKYEILKTMPVFDSIDPIYGHPISNFDTEKGESVHGTTRSLLKYIEERVQADILGIDAINQADRFILSNVLIQRVRDITEETSMHRVLEYLAKQTPILNSTNQYISQNESYTAHAKESVKASIEELLHAIEGYKTNIIQIQENITAQSNVLSILFAAIPGISAVTLQENQEKGGAMVPEIKKLIDGESGLREECMKALTFALRDLPTSLKHINDSLNTPEEQIMIEQLETAGINQAVLAEVATKPNQTKLTELEIKKADIQANLELLDTTLQELITELETAQTKVASVRSEKNTIEVRIKLAQTQAKINASPSKSKAKFSATHDEIALLENKAAAEALEIDLVGKCALIITKIDDLLDKKVLTEESLTLTQREIDTLHAAFTDAQSAYKSSQEIFVHTKDMLDNTLAQKLIDLHSEQLASTNSCAASLLDVENDASFRRAKLENEVNANLIGILETTKMLIQSFKDKDAELQQRCSDNPTAENKAALLAFHAQDGEVVSKVLATKLECTRRKEEKEIAFVKFKTDYEFTIAKEEQYAKDMLDLLEATVNKAAELAHTEHDAALKEARMLVINAYEHLQEAAKDINIGVDDISFVDTTVIISAEETHAHDAAQGADVEPIGAIHTDE